MLGIEIARFENFNEASTVCKKLNRVKDYKNAKNIKDYVIIKISKNHYSIRQLEKSTIKHKIHSENKERIFKLLPQLIDLRKNHVCWDKCSEILKTPKRTLQYYYKMWKDGGILDFEIEYNPLIHEYKRIDYKTYQKEYREKHKRVEKTQ